MPVRIRRVLQVELVLLLFAAILVVPEAAGFAPLLNPHSSFGGLVLLLAWVFALFASVWLFVVLPGQISALAHGRIGRTHENLCVVGLGVVAALLMGGWVVHTLVSA